MCITSAVPVGEVGEPPDVTESHGIPETRQHEVQFVTPVPAFFILVTLESALYLTGLEGK